MAGDSLRASAPTAAPTEGTTSSPSSFAFKPAAPFEGELCRAGAPGWQVSADGLQVRLFRCEGAVRVGLDLTPEQARAVGAELIAAADAAQPREAAPQAASASNARGA